MIDKGLGRMTLSLLNNWEK